MKITKEIPPPTIFLEEDGAPCWDFHAVAAILGVDAVELYNAAHALSVEVDARYGLVKGGKPPHI